MMVLLALPCLAAQARAETFKWVDERGVVNYSNQPSPARNARSTLVEERISTYQSPPLHSVALNRAPDYEWLQRQRIMAEMAAAKVAPAECGYRADCREPYSMSYAYPLVPLVAARSFHRTPLRMRATRSVH